MDLGYKKLNNLTSKDFTLQKQAAKEIVDHKDIEAFKILNEKAEFIFDFIKEKITKNLILAINQNNVMNLFEFTKIYSEDFANFILEPLIKFSTKEIEDKMFSFLKIGSDEQKAYALEFFINIQNAEVVKYAKENINSIFEPLRANAIKFLAKYNVKEEYNSALNCLINSDDDYEKLKSVEFLTYYKDINAYPYILNYLKQTGTNEVVAGNLLLLKNFETLILENKKEDIFLIYSSLLYNFPDSVTFEEILEYNKEGVLNYLIELPDNFASIMILFLQDKLRATMQNEAYSLDFSGNTRKDAESVLSSLNLITEYEDKATTIKNGLLSDFKTEILMALQLADETFNEEIQNLLNTTIDNEIILLGLNCLKAHGTLTGEFIDKIKNKVENVNIKYEIENLHS